ncbi:protein RRNAD1 isoform X2 [Telopea speciosissima]|uniref:protein RRNAD1 isoform X2 n=1 Tax=Telopea speciosissima TaxID=54955 RepID=UPI001CC663EB|nr:protein RRNAD1 isoform X2 [Telopea speciosissima]
MARNCRYSCETAVQTLEWINAIIAFLRPHRFLCDAHVVNFFKDRLWESVDEQWMECLRVEPVENLLKIPSGMVQDYWPSSLKEFILVLRSLVLPQEQTALQMMFPNLHVASLSSVLTQGMNLKKKHEVEILAAIVNSTARKVGGQTIIDVGAGQGYLAQVLSFQYHLSVVAIDASSHLGEVTSARAERIKKHYLSKMRKARAANAYLSVPQTVTCRVLSSETLKALSDYLLHNDNDEQSKHIVEGVADVGKEPSLCNDPNNESSLVLAGLHACGDLSVTMLRTFLECREVKAVVSIGCCYNLLSEEGSENTGPQCGFPMSESAKLAGFSFGKNARDLACQSAERWRNLTRDAALQNFDLHAFRAVFQMVLCRYYPEVWKASPSIGRKGKALRRQQQRRVLESNLRLEEYGQSCSTSDIDSLSPKISSSNNMGEGSQSYTVDKCSLFENFCKSGLCRLGLVPSQEIDFLGVWKEAQHFSELVGPYWSLRAALGPLLETLILLDRLLFLQEQGNMVEATVVPIFDPRLSPRNVAIIAWKKDPDFIL